MNTKRMYRQGDLLLVEEPTLPATASQRATRVILEGEASGHTHQIQNGVLYSSVMGALLVVAHEGARLVHDEHGPIEVAPGVYRAIRQREDTTGGFVRPID